VKKYEGIQFLHFAHLSVVFQEVTEVCIRSSSGLDFRRFLVSGLRVQGRSAGSISEQRLVIEPNLALARSR